MIPNKFALEYFQKHAFGLEDIKKVFGGGEDPQKIILENQPVLEQLSKIPAESLTPEQKTQMATLQGKLSAAHAALFKQQQSGYDPTKVSMGNYSRAKIWSDWAAQNKGVTDPRNPAFISHVGQQLDTATAALSNMDQQLDSLAEKANTGDPEAAKAWKTANDEKIRLSNFVKMATPWKVRAEAYVQEQTKIKNSPHRIDSNFYQVPDGAGGMKRIRVEDMQAWREQNRLKQAQDPGQAAANKVNAGQTPAGMATKGPSIDFNSPVTTPPSDLTTGVPSAGDQPAPPAQPPTPPATPPGEGNAGTPTPGTPLPVGGENTNQYPSTYREPPAAQKPVQKAPPESVNPYAHWAGKRRTDMQAAVRSAELASGRIPAVEGDEEAQRRARDNAWFRNIKPHRDETAGMEMRNWSPR